MTVSCQHSVSMKEGDLLGTHAIPYRHMVIKYTETDSRYESIVDDEALMTLNLLAASRRPGKYCFKFLKIS